MERQKDGKIENDRKMERYKDRKLERWKDRKKKGRKKKVK